MRKKNTRSEFKLFNGLSINLKSIFLCLTDMFLSGEISIKVLRSCLEGIKLNDVSSAEFIDCTLNKFYRDGVVYFEKHLSRSYSIFIAKEPYFSAKPLVFSSSVLNGSMARMQGTVTRHIHLKNIIVNCFSDISKGKEFNFRRFNELVNAIDDIMGSDRGRFKGALSELKGVIENASSATNNEFDFTYLFHTLNETKKSIWDFYFFYQHPDFEQEVKNIIYQLPSLEKQLVSLLLRLYNLSAWDLWKNHEVRIFQGVCSEIQADVNKLRCDHDVIDVENSLKRTLHVHDKSHLQFDQSCREKVMSMLADSRMITDACRLESVVLSTIQHSTVVDENKLALLAPVFDQLNTDWIRLCNEINFNLFDKPKINFICDPDKFDAQSHTVLFMQGKLYFYYACKGWATRDRGLLTQAVYNEEEQGSNLGSAVKNLIFDAFKKNGKNTPEFCTTKYLYDKSGQAKQHKAFDARSFNEFVKVVDSHFRPWKGQDRYAVSVLQCWNTSRLNFESNMSFINNKRALPNSLYLSAVNVVERAKPPRNTLFSSGSDSMDFSTSSKELEALQTTLDEFRHNSLLNISKNEQEDAFESFKRGNLQNDIFPLLTESQRQHLTVCAVSFRNEVLKHAKAARLHSYRGHSRLAQELGMCLCDVLLNDSRLSATGLFSFVSEMAKALTQYSNHLSKRIMPISHAVISAEYVIMEYLYDLIDNPRSNNESVDNVLERIRSCTRPLESDSQLKVMVEAVLNRFSLNNGAVNNRDLTMSG